MNGHVWNPERFREIAREKDLDLRRLSTLTGISYEEREKALGHRDGNPSLDTIVRIADYLAVPLDFLMGRCTEEEANNLMKDYAANIDKIRPSFGQETESPWPYNLITDLYLEPIDYVLTEDQINGLNFVLDSLPERQKDILVSHYHGTTYRELGKKYNVTAVRIRQLFVRTLWVLRAPKNKKLITLGLELSQRESKIAQEERELAARQFALERERIEADPRMQAIAKVKLEEMELSVRAYNCLY